ncbi:uncharacterized protein EI97DRAFT_287662 [Westerdykella ornata]|uniref:Glutamyl-tRNA synthetase n=1 Tax=Westerdykella ornata TaxID=318751 RepID=A0A6A6JL67_WESOR|nr:uncharacterized protein EI97DRAFT_287662 [Westerdykella ornata]KAF2277331.1 hypothetical protein EI97DRAFT_287662 [Westerdykella ornata]
MSTPYDCGLAAIDAAHALDPNTIPNPNPSETSSSDTPSSETPTIPYELHYAQKCTSYLHKLCPSPSEALRLAIRAQHFRRWEVPRSTYPMTRAGYHAWRTYVKKRQAELVEAICLDSGYAAEIAARVAALIRKEGLREGDEEAQTLEDVACLVFLEDQLDRFERELGDEEKMVGILQKTWEKMSRKGKELALEIEMSERGKRLVKRALEGE